MELIEMAREMGKKIQQDNRYLELQEAKLENDNDQELQDLIGEFNLKRISINNEMGKESVDKEKVDLLNQELQAVYGKIMDNANMKNYNDKKNAMDQLMQHINAILSMSVNGEDPETCELPKGCSGSCSSCGGCH